MDTIKKDNCVQQTSTGMIAPILEREERERERKKKVNKIRISILLW